MEHTSLVCPCGAPVPLTLGPTDTRPVPCPRCGTPLVGREGPSGEDVERAAGAALLTASGAAVAWLFAARATGTGAHWMLPIVAAVIGVTSVRAARARAPGVAAAALTGFGAFVLLGEILLYRGALFARLLRLHTAEGAEDPTGLAVEEASEMDVSQYLHLELELTLFIGLSLALAVLWWLTRPRHAFVAFMAPGSAAAADDAAGAAGAADADPIGPDGPHSSDDADDSEDAAQTNEQEADPWR